jgi:very-short-patch-repair endonuclease
MRLDDLLASTPVLAVSDHPAQTRTFQRAAAAGVLAALLPGVYVRPEHATDAAVRLLAVSAWSRHGALCGRTAVELFTHSPITMPVLLRSPNRARPAAWLQVCRGRVPAEHRLSYRGINTVTPAYAAVEVAGTDGGAALFEFLRDRLVTPSVLAATLPAFDHQPGNPRRRAIVLRAVSNPWSFAEARLHDLLDAAGIVGWVANQPVRVGGVQVIPDVLFAQDRLALEFDGEAVHSGHEQFEKDRWRQNLLAAAGYRVLRITWTMLNERPLHVLEVIRQLLAES